MFGLLGETQEGGRSLGCVQQRGLLEKLKRYLPMCSPVQGEGNSLKGCLSAMEVKYTHAAEVREGGVCVCLVKRQAPYIFSTWLQILLCCLSLHVP